MLEEYKVETLAEVVNLLEERMIDGNFIFRGVVDKAHGLVPKVGRDINPNNPGRKIGRVKERDIFEKFKRMAIPYQDRKPENSLEWMVLAQHHSLPTRLLDWTSNPLVGLFFAVREIYDQIHYSSDWKLLKRETIDGALYVLKKPMPAPYDYWIDPFSIDNVSLVDPPHFAQRVVRQSGLLTLHPEPEVPWVPLDGDLLKLIIPSAKKLSMKIQLDSLGVNEATLMAGLDAIGQYLFWRVKNNLPVN